MTDWEPIETAPKDGTKFLASAGASIKICAWGDLMSMRYDTDKGQYIRTYGWVVAYAPPVTTMRPTHWLPLPSPPDAR